MLKFLVVTAALGIVFNAAPALADRPTTGYVDLPHESGPHTASIGPGTIIYLNKHGGTFTPGQDDSRTNKSSVAASTSTLSAFNCSDAVWQQVMTCVKDQFSPFNVTVTDVDPGSTPHVESVVAGNPGELKTQQYPQGLPCGNGGCVGGIAPLGCDLYLDNPITYSFANIYQCDAQSICETVAQETAHAFGLDHENYCPDPMTYQTGCGNKKYRDHDAPCGEYSNRSCMCTNASTQNSVKTLLAIFGPSNGTDAPPTVAITQPANNATVAPGFAVAATASDDKSLVRVELWVDGAKVGEKTAAPFSFNAPAGLADGAHTIMARAVDSANQTKDAQIGVNLSSGGSPPPGCDNTSNPCPTGFSCTGGQCVAVPTGGDGQLGTPCTDGSQCMSGTCGTGPDGMRCTQVCTPGGSDCPVGFDCLPAGSGGACWPQSGGNPDDGPFTVHGGCAVGGSHASSLAGLAGFLAIMLAARRRRRS